MFLKETTGGGFLTALPVEKNGSLGADTQDIQHEGKSIAKNKPYVHSTFHPNKKFYYVVTELNSTVNAFSYKKGNLSALQSISMLPEGYTGKGDGADIHVSKDGKFLYASTRNAVNEIVVFRLIAYLAFHLILKYPLQGEDIFFQSLACIFNCSFFVLHFSFPFSFCEVSFCPVVQPFVYPDHPM